MELAESLFLVFLSARSVDEVAMSVAGRRREIDARSRAEIFMVD